MYYEITVYELDTIVLTSPPMALTSPDAALTIYGKLRKAFSESAGYTIRIKKREEDDGKDVTQEILELLERTDPS